MKRSQIYRWKSYCSEPLDKIEHYEEAKADNFAGWCIHHRLEIQQDKRVSRQELKDKDLYYDRPASELIFMRFEEHSTLHNKGQNNPLFGKHHSAEARKKMSEARKGRTFSEEHRKKIAEAHKGENNPMFGKHHTEESRQKMSKTRKVMLWWNNGISNKRCRECPGEGWTRGRLRFK